MYPIVHICLHDSYATLVGFSTISTSAGLCMADMMMLYSKRVVPYTFSITIDYPYIESTDIKGY